MLNVVGMRHGGDTKKKKKKKKKKSGFEKERRCPFRSYLHLPQGTQTLTRHNIPNPCSTINRSTQNLRRLMIELDSCDFSTMTNERMKISFFKMVGLGQSNLLFFSFLPISLPSCPEIPCDDGGIK
jgi:hypothetical protein